MKANNVVIIDYGVGNLLSVKRGFENCNINVQVSSDPHVIIKASHAVLPGVGAFGNAMEALEKHGLADTLREIGQKQKPLLGICLGMQLLLDESEEFGKTMGLGLISGKVVSIPALSKTGETLKSPHIGWGEIKPRESRENWDGTALDVISENDAVYFVHSFMSIPNDIQNVIAETDFGGHNIPAVISNGTIIACQFHPEKSGPAGLKILRRFCEY